MSNRLARWGAGQLEFFKIFFLKPNLSPSDFYQELCLSCACTQNTDGGFYLDGLRVLPLFQTSASPFGCAHRFNAPTSKSSEWRRRR